MTIDRDPDEILSAWLDEGPLRLPDQTRRAIAVAIPVTAQRRHVLNVPWRFHSMSTTLKLAVGAMAVIAVVMGGAFVLGPPRDTAVGGPAAPSPTPTAAPTPAPSPTPLPSPAPSIDVTGWTPYMSDRYGLSLGYPPDWTVRPSERDWSLKTDVADAVSPAHDAFVAPDGSVRVSVWAVPVGPEADVEAWIEAYCPKATTPCSGIPDRAVPLCIERRDCHPGLLVPFTDDTQAFLTGGIFGGQMVVAAIWRAERDPSVASYGGSRRLLEAFLSTMSVWPESVPLEQRHEFAVPSPQPS